MKQALYLVSELISDSRHWAADNAVNDKPPLLTTKTVVTLTGHTDWPLASTKLYCIMCLTTCPELLHDSAVARSWTCKLPNLNSKALTNETSMTFKMQQLNQKKMYM